MIDVFRQNHNQIVDMLARRISIWSKIRRPLRSRLDLSMLVEIVFKISQRKKTKHRRVTYVSFSDVHNDPLYFRLHRISSNINAATMKLNSHVAVEFRSALELCHWTIQLNCLCPPILLSFTLLCCFRPSLLSFELHFLLNKSSSHCSNQVRLVFQRLTWDII